MVLILAGSVRSQRQLTSFLCLFSSNSCRMMILAAATASFVPSEFDRKSHEQKTNRQEDWREEHIASHESHLSTSLQISSSCPLENIPRAHSIDSEREEEEERLEQTF